MVNKQEQLIKVISFYEKQIEVLDNMLIEITERYKNSENKNEKEDFHKRFAEKQILINDLKTNLYSNNVLLTADIAQNQGRMADKFLYQNIKIEEEVAQFEKEINELNKDFKNYLIENLKPNYTD
jgi:hypothetical protein